MLWLVAIQIWMASLVNYKAPCLNSLLVPQERLGGKNLLPLAACQLQRSPHLQNEAAVARSPQKTDPEDVIQGLSTLGNSKGTQLRLQISWWSLQLSRAQKIKVGSSFYSHTQESQLSGLTISSDKIQFSSTAVSVCERIICVCMVGCSHMKNWATLCLSFRLEK